MGLGSNIARFESLGSEKIARIANICHDATIEKAVLVSASNGDLNRCRYVRGRNHMDLIARWSGRVSCDELLGHIPCLNCVNSGQIWCVQQSVNFGAIDLARAQ